MTTQEAACRKYASEHGYIVDDEHFFREQFSGFTRDRPMLAQVRELVRAREIDALIFYAVDRLGRNQTDLYILVDEMEKNAVQIVCVTEPFDSSAMGKLIMSVRAYAAEVEREKIKERTVRGKRQTAAEGKMPGGGGYNLYGYRYVKRVGKRHEDLCGGKREIDSDTAPVVQQMFRWVGDEGLTLGDVARRLMDRGIPAAKGGTIWAPGVISTILRNRAYVGETNAFRMTSVAPKTRRSATLTAKTSNRATPREQWVSIPGATPALVDADLFERVQERLRYNLQHARRNAHRTYLLSSHLRCEVCDSTYTASHARVNGKDHFYYRCGASNKAAMRQRCGSLSLRMAATDDAIWAYVRSILEDPAQIVAELEAQRAAQGTNDVERDLEAISEQLAKLAARERKLLALALDSDDDESTLLFQREQRAISEQRSRLKAEQERLQETATRDVISPEMIASIEEFCARVRHNLDTLTIDEQREVLDMLKIVVIVEQGGKDGVLRISGRIPSSAIVLAQC